MPVVEQPKKFEFVRQWNVNEKLISVLRDADLLEYIVMNYYNSNSLSSKINYANTVKIEDVISQITKTEVFFESDESLKPIFCNVLLSCTCNEKYDVKLLFNNFNKALIWQIFDNDTKRFHWVHFKDSVCSKRCFQETINVINDLKNQSLASIVRSLEQDYRIGVRVGLIIELEPKSVISRIDHRINVTKHIWAIALTTGPRGPMFSKGAHSSIVFEGINDGSIPEIKGPIGEYFMCLTHFRGPDIKTIDLTYQDLEYDKRTKIWMISAQKISDMMKIVELETENLPKFSKYGSESILKKGHSCFTWAREKLSLVDVYLGKSIWGWIFTNPKDYTKIEKYHKKFNIKNVV